MRSWKQIARALGVAESTAIYLYRCDPEAVLEDDLARQVRLAEEQALVAVSDRFRL